MAIDSGTLITLLEQYGYLIVFIAALAEAFPFLSIVVPGQAIIIVAGAFAADGHLSIAWVILLAIPAGIIGDWAGFWIGRKYGRSVFERFGPKFGVKEKHLQKSDELFDKYGAFALVIFRFSFLTRPVGPILAGMSRMKDGVFWLWNVVGAVLWAVGYGLFGYFLGIAFLQLEGVIGQVLAWTIAGAVGIYVLYRLLRRYADQFTRDDLLIALIGVAGGTGFGLLADRIARVGLDNFLDRYADVYVSTLAFAEPLWAVLEVVASYAVLGVVALGVAIYLAAKRHVWQASLVALGVGGAIVLTQVLQPVFAGAVPPEAREGGFPSAYATVSIVAAGILTFVLASHMHRARVPILAAAGGWVFALLASVARVAQGRELPSAAAGGLCLGVAWLAIAILLIEFGIKRAPRKAA